MTGAADCRNKVNDRNPEFQKHLVKWLRHPPKTHVTRNTYHRLLVTSLLFIKARLFTLSFLWHENFPFAWEYYITSLIDDRWFSIREFILSQSARATLLSPDRSGPVPFMINGTGRSKKVTCRCPWEYPQVDPQVPLFFFVFLTNFLRICVDAAEIIAKHPDRTLDHVLSKCWSRLSTQQWFLLILAFNNPSYPAWVPLNTSRNVLWVCFILFLYLFTHLLFYVFMTWMNTNGTTSAFPF